MAITYNDIYYYHHVCLSARKYQPGSYRTDRREIFFWGEGGFMNIYQENQNLLKSDKKKGLLHEDQNMFLCSIWQH